MSAPTPSAKLRVVTPDVIEHQATNHYFDRNFNIQSVKVLPGEFYVTIKEQMIVTVLGSCVAACIRDKDLGVGGLNHFMLPDSGGGVASTSARYGAYAMELLINNILKMGGRRHRLEAKIFGGGRVMATLANSNVGERNVAFVREFLRNENIPIVAEDLLDVYPRKVYFFPFNGKVKLKKLLSTHNDTLAQREQAYVATLSKQEVSGDVELF